MKILGKLKMASKHFVQDAWLMYDAKSSLDFKLTFGLSQITTLQI